MIQQKQNALRTSLLLLLALCISTALAHTVFIQPGAPLQPGLDSSWAYGVNYTFYKRLLLGRDVYFTFGPLGFLEHTRALTNSMLNGTTLFWSACTLLLSLLTLRLCWLAATSRAQLFFNLLIGVLLILSTTFPIFRLLLLIYATALLHWIDTKRIWLVLAGTLCSLALLIKFSYGIVALALFMPYTALVSLRDKSWLNAFAFIFTLLGSYLFTWWMIYNQLNGALGYLQGGLEFSRGSTTAMALDPPNNWYAVVSFYAIILASFFIASIALRKQWLLMPICFLGPLFIWSKYAFGREDAAHLGFLMVFVFHVLPLLAITHRFWDGKAVCMLALILSYIAWAHMHNRFIGAIDFRPSLSIANPIPNKIWWPNKNLKLIFDQESENRLSALKLPASLRTMIGNNTADIYPWESLIAAANQLNWTPRPVYQNYISYTPFLDGANQKFFESDKAPEFIVWHYHSFPDVDSRYPLNSDPLTLESILRHYRIVQCDSSFCVWQRSKPVQLSPTKIGQAAINTWNTWITLPNQIDADILRLHVNPELTALGKLNQLLWKEGSVEIDYRLKNGSIRTHKVVQDNAVSGLWASPYLEGIYSDSQRVRPFTSEQWQAWQQTKPAEGYVESATISASGIQIYGWGFYPFLPSASQQVSILLINDNHQYRISAPNRPRPGITAHFGKTGAVDLDTSGFDVTIPTTLIAPGAYQVRFLVENQNNIALSAPQTATLTVPEHASPHNVEAIRLRTSHPWAFNPSLTYHWGALTFTGEKPW